MILCEFNRLINSTKMFELVDVFSTTCEETLELS